jgi:hypothetical protein
VQTGGHQKQCCSVRAIKFGGLILFQFCGVKCVNLNLISFRAEAEVHTVCLLLFPGQTSFVTLFDGSVIVKVSFFSIMRLIQFVQICCKQNHLT